ncbi:MAG: TIGR03032 family protein [Planctomycetales bacterium]|nr:TIGR03032 family protein [Planctomycetales bacterium]
MSHETCETDYGGSCGPSDGSQLQSVHTDNLPRILDRFGCSVAVTTYQAGKLILLRSDGAGLNTHFRSFTQPMGLALSSSRLAIGTDMQIWEYHNVPAVNDKVDTARTHDACFLPRLAHHTGNIQIHEMGWVDNELWFVNTLFSCLCTRSDEHSFVPCWRPPFVTAYAPEDRCHLNGMCVVNGEVRYVTALGRSDTQGGWRDNKKSGGVLIDVPTGEIIASNLCMPHSPRYYGDRLWVLNSGEGGVGVVDRNSGCYDEIARLPGFTRGLCFHGRLAFIGLSQVRDSAVFSGIPVAELEERTCGVWVLNIDTGETVGFVRFEEAVREIFAVEMLPGYRFPDVINDNRELMASSYVLPDEALRDVPVGIRASV